MQATPNAGTAQCARGARVVLREAICREHVWIECALPEFPPSVPGQFLQLLCREEDSAGQECEQEWPADGFPSLHNADVSEVRPYLRRPFSIADRWDTAAGTTHLVIISRAIGVGTRWLDRLAEGDELNITGPLGRGFRIPALDVPLLLIGGGVGIPPLLYFARQLWAAGHRDVTLVLGALARDLLAVHLVTPPAEDGTPTPCVMLPGGAPYDTIITSDDGSIGMQGRVTTGLARWYDLRGATASGTLVCACGPEGMLHAVARQTRALGFACQLCIERPMGCGVGTCLSCVVRRRDDHHPAGWRWALACSDGPVFERDELLDYADAERA